MIMHIILTLSMLPIVPAIYFAMKNEADINKNMILGITLPSEHLEDNEVKQIQAEYKKELKKLILSSLPVLILPFFIPSTSVVFSIDMLWILFICFFTYYPFSKYHKKLKKLKIEHQWGTYLTKEPVIDLKEFQLKHNPFPHYLFIPSCILGIPPVIFLSLNREPSTVYYVKLITILIFAFITFFCYGMYFILKKQKIEVIENNIEINQALTKIRQKQWNRFLCIFSYINTVYIWIIWIYLEKKWLTAMWFMIVTMIYSSLLFIITSYSEWNVQKFQQKLVNEYFNDAIIEDDSHWINGMFYYNSNDTHVMVEKRVGIGTTINMARPIGKVILVFTMICLLSLPLSCIWMFFEEYTPVHLIIKNNILVSSHLKNEYAVPLSSVKKIEYLDKLPDHSKIVGIGMDNLCKGNFSVLGYGDCKVCLNPENQAFIIIYTSDKTYIFNDEDENVTMQIFNAIQ